MTPERCLKCDWWNHNRSACDRIFKATIRVATDAGEIRLETQPGLLPKYLEDDFSAWLVLALGDFIDAWPGWAEIKRIRDGGKECPSHKPSVAVRDFGKHLKLAKPLTISEPQPEKNLDHLGLFKSDVSVW